MFLVYVFSVKNNLLMIGGRCEDRITKAEVSFFIKTSDAIPRRKPLIGFLGKFLHRSVKLNDGCMILFWSKNICLTLAQGTVIKSETDF